MSSIPTNRRQAIAWPGKTSWNLNLWFFNMAMENGPFTDDFPIKTTIYSGFSMAMLNNQMVDPGAVWPLLGNLLKMFLRHLKIISYLCVIGFE